ncbi:AI-2E family transporter [Aquicoccus sp. G2-2]|uniref:AI-2E family transporter n=1 Tax=Aquicoccus sp. G2-2 TaxID=3092120 RepID=UPI002ADF564B|nr:AI-2E family transporter [Aquicoccus sp. G2-2]MEA1115251.1 AI-2E family transporter [Aquicoccus sp. G2-2]
MDAIDRAAKLAVIAVGVIACFAALDALESIAAPTALALVTGIVLSPLSYFWERRGFSPLIGALLGLVGTLVIVAGLMLTFQPVIARLVEQAPKVWSDMRDAIEFVQHFVRGMQEAREEVEKVVTPAADAASKLSNAGDAAPKGEGLGLPTVSDALLAAPAVLSQILIFAGVLFFFLLTRRNLYDWVASQLPGGNTDHPRASLREAENLVSRYFLTITLINAGLGVVTAGMLQIYGMPGAAGLGVVAFLLNFILYLGPAVFFCSLVFAGIGVFDGVMVVLPALTFLGLNTIEGQLVTPTLVGRHMQLNPLVVFLALVFGIWLWGPLGGIVAIPVVLWLLVVTGVLPREVADASLEEAKRP